LQVTRSRSRSRIIIYDTSERKDKLRLRGKIRPESVVVVLLVVFRTWKFEPRYDEKAMRKERNQRKEALSKLSGKEVDEQVA